MADSLGVRRQVAYCRDRLVATLTGGQRVATGNPEVSKGDFSLGTGDHSVATENSIDRHQRMIWDRSQCDDKHLVLLLSFGLHRSANCLDVGANKGLFLADYRRVAPLGYHIAYEPLPNLHEVLVRMYPDMEIRQRALSDREGTSSFVHVTDPDYDGYSGFKEQPYPVAVKTEALETIEVVIERLDGHLPEGWLPDFVKIDVEGAQGLVIAGAIDTFRRARPVMSIEHGWNSGEPFGFSDDDFYDVICQEIGLRLFDMDGGGPFERAQFMDALHSVDRWNWIAHD